MPPPLYRPPAPHDWKLIQVEVGQLIKSTAAGLSHERASDRLGTVPWAFVATPAAASAASAADAALPPPVVPTLAANNASLPSSQGSPSPPLRAPPRAPRPRARRLRWLTDMLRPTRGGRMVIRPLRALLPVVGVVGMAAVVVVRATPTTSRP